MEGDGMPKYKDADEVLRLLYEALEASFAAKERGNAVDKAFTRRFQEFAEALRELELREALKVLCMETVGPLARQVAPFTAFPTKKVRFNVFPQSEEKLEQVKKAHGEKTTKDAIDTVLEWLFTRLPADYWDHTSEVTALLSEHLPRAGGARPVSLAMNGLGYALLQALAEMLEQPQGAVLEAAIALWLTELRSEGVKTEKARAILNEFYAHATVVEAQLKEMFDGPGPHIFGDENPICARFGLVMVPLANLCAAIEANIDDGVPIDPEDPTQTG
jgi:hypothetical protein